MADAADLVEVEHVLRQVLNGKGQWAVTPQAPSASQWFRASTRVD